MSSLSIIYFSEDTQQLAANTFAVSLKDNKVVPKINNIINNISTDWILFWDKILGEPDTTLILKLIATPIDVWHGSIRMGLSGLPSIVNYVDPTWIYNKDAAENIIHSSFRLSLRACLLRTSVIKSILPLPAYYQSIDMLGLSAGYQLIKSGAIMRYHPHLVSRSQPVVKIPDADEWKFARQIYKRKWCWWIIANKPGIVSNIRNYISAHSVSYKKVIPRIHSSIERNNLIDKPAISVLAPTLKRYPYLMNELKQLSEQTILPFEVLITDQTDIEERQLIDAALFPKLTIRYFPQEEKGQCLAWNKLLEESKGEYVLFLGDDADHITPDFIEKLFETMIRFDADMVASNVIEIGIPEKKINHHYYMTNLFPITLIKKSTVDKSGRMDMFFNRNIRADHDLAMRCHLNGSLMIFNPSATIHHHRASVGGLRAHKARVITNYIAKNSLTKFTPPTSSEIYLVKKYYTEHQYKQYIKIKYFNQLLPHGGFARKLAKFFVFILKYPQLRKAYLQNLRLADEALKKRNDYQN